MNMRRGTDPGIPGRPDITQSALLRICLTVPFTAIRRQWSKLVSHSAVCHARPGCADWEFAVRGRVLAGHLVVHEWGLDFDDLRSRRGPIR